ncbi:hypothetical protein [Macrococcoides caseolyticum]|uniref:hypothetical protein n=1 Tax=Macrococcoides caseolyticum TaxID=69966 RepID=UPI000C3271C8|nr:hypothetical protein [Macrococcus caseolyticus]PKE47678.1 hypothetical protein CW677_06665 [Macrococcus caseolyticus]PKF14638.1 hypothetical protein CW690_06665 [Macrococcus caseolyticus]
MPIKANDKKGNEVYASDLTDYDKQDTFTCLGCNANLSLIISSKSEKINHFAVRGNNKHEDGCKYSFSMKYNIIDTEFNINSFFDSILSKKSTTFSTAENINISKKTTRNNDITNLRTFVTYCRQHKTSEYIGDTKISECFLDQRIFKRYLSGFKGNKVVIPYMRYYDKKEKSFIMKYGNRLIKVFFHNDKLFSSLINEYHEIKNVHDDNFHEYFKLAIIGEWCEKSDFICTNVYKKRQISNVASIILVT